MAHDMTVGGVNGLSYSLLSRQNPHEDATSVLRRRLGDDVVKDKPKTGVDHFSRTMLSDDERLTNSLRKLAERHQAATQQFTVPAPPTTPPATPATPGTAAANTSVSSLAALTTAAPALVVSLQTDTRTATADHSVTDPAPTSTSTSDPAPSTTTTSDTAPATTTTTDPATSMPVSDTSTTTSSTSGTTTTTTTSTSGTTTTSSSGGKSAAAPGHTK